MNGNKSFGSLLAKGLWNKFKGLLKLILRLLLALVFIGVVMYSCAYSYIKTNDFQKAEATYGLKQEVVEYIYTSNIEKPELLGQIDDFIKQQPDYVKKTFEKENWEIVISDKLSSVLIDEVQLVGIDGDSLKINEYDGLTIPDAKIIYISSQKTDTDLYKNFLHEFGHYFDYINGYLSITYKFEKLYKENSSLAYFTTYELSNSTEFFAASYCKYKQEPDFMKREFPDLFNYFSEIETKANTYNEFVYNLSTGTLGTIEKGKLFIRELIKEVKNFDIF